LRYGAVADGTTDNTTAFNNCVTAANGGRMTIPYAGALSYRTDRITFATADSNLYIFIEPGVELECIAAGTGIFRGNDASNITISGFGATCTMAAQAGGSSNVNFSGGSNILIEGLRVIGAGASKDAIYIGVGATSIPCYNVTIRKCYIKDAQRNQISIVGGFHTVIEDNEIAGGSTVNPGAGIDLEANIYNAVKHTTIRNNWIHDCHNYGILNAFGQDGLIEGNLIEDIGITPIQISGGGSWDENGAFHDVRRPVSAFNLSTGAVTTHTPDNPPTPWEEGMHKGQMCQFIALNGKVAATELTTQVRWTVQTVNGGVVTLAASDDMGEVVSLSDAGNATLSSDPDVTELYLITYQEGAASGYIVRNNTINSTCTLGNYAALIVMGDGSVNCICEGNILRSGAATGGIQLIYCEGNSVTGNRIYGDLGTTHVSHKGLTSATGSKNSVNDNFVHGFSGGISLSSISNTTMNIGYIQNCGVTDTVAIEIVNCKNLTISGLTLLNDPDYTPTYGLLFSNSATHSCAVNNCTIDCGVSDANSIFGLPVYSTNNMVNGLLTGSAFRYNGIPTVLDDTYINFAPGAVSVDLSPNAGVPAVWVFDGTNFLPIAAPQITSAYTPTNVATDRAFDANRAVTGTGIDVAAVTGTNVALLSDHDALVNTVRELSDVVGTLIADLQGSDTLS